MFLPVGNGAVRRCKKRAERGRRGVVSGNDQRVAVVIYKHACVCVCVCVCMYLSLTGLLSADGSIMTVLIYDLSLSPTHSTSFLPFSLNTPPSNSFLHSFSGSLSLCRQGALSHVHTIAREPRNGREMDFKGRRGKVSEN